MAEYRVVSTDVRTGARVADVELRGLKVSHRLKRPPTVKGSVALPSLDSDAAIARARSINDAVDEKRRLLVVERDGVAIGHGVVWAAPYAGKAREVEAAGLESVLYRRHITARQAFSGVDQFSIVRALVDYTQAKAGGHLGITHNSGLSGVTRDRVYEWFEMKEIGEAIEQMADVENGFDFAIDVSWNPATGALSKVLNLANRRGQPYTSTGHVFTYGGNIIDFGWPSDGSESRNMWVGVGAGEGARAIMAAAVDAYQIQDLTSGGPGYPLLEGVMAEKDISNRATLQDKVNARLWATTETVTIPKLRVRADLDPVLGSYITGDACRIIVPPGVEPRFPDGLDTFRRIIGWDLTVGENGDEVVDLHLGLEP